MSCIKGFHKSHVEMSKKATFFSKKGEVHCRAWLSVRMILCASDFTQPLWESVRPFLAGNGNIAFRVIMSSLLGGCSGWQRCTTAILLMLQFSMAHLTNLFMSSVNYTFGEEVVSPCEHAAKRGKCQTKILGKQWWKAHVYSFFQALFFQCFFAQWRLVRLLSKPGSRVRAPK